MKLSEPRIQKKEFSVKVPNTLFIITIALFSSAALAADDKNENQSKQNEKWQCKGKIATTGHGAEHAKKRAEQHCKKAGGKFMTLGGQDRSAFGREPFICQSSSAPNGEMQPRGQAGGEPGQASGASQDVTMSKLEKARQTCEKLLKGQFKAGGGRMSSNPTPG